MKAEGAKTQAVSSELKYERRFTKKGAHPFDGIIWEKRDAEITDANGKTVFSQKGVEVPSTWSQQAVKIAVSKYFRGQLGTANRETSVKQLVGRVATTIANWGKQGNYFSGDEEAEIFEHELTHILASQMAAFNSPVWFNVGIEPHPQSSACFINSLKDDMRSILNLTVTEGMLFKYGSGTGTNFSTLRSSREHLSFSTGRASGPVSFMKGFDAFAGVIKCLTPDSYVYTDKGMLQLGEIISVESQPGFHEEDSIVLATKDGPRRTSQTYVSPKSPVIKISLNYTGLELKGTSEHPVLTLDENLEMGWKRLADVKTRDRIAVARKIETWPLQPPEFSFEPLVRNPKIKISYPKVLTPELSRLLGYLTSEGSMEKTRFRFSNADKDVMDDFVLCIEKVFGVKLSPHKIRKKINHKTGVITYEFTAEWTGAVAFLKHVGCYGKSQEKIVPWCVRRAPREFVKNFIQAYFEGDGHVSILVFAASASKKLLQEIQLLLLNFGMVSSLKPHVVQDKEYFQLSLRGREAKAFVEKIGFLSQRKRRAAAIPLHSNTNVDVVPNVVKAIRKYAVGKNGYYECTDGTVQMVGFGFFNRTGSNVSYEKLKATAGLLEKSTLISPTLGESLKALMYYEFFWDAVETKEEAEPCITYDFTVPETHSFIANGIVNHNSGGRTRRAAKMVILNADHPDIVEFINCKANEEKKAWALIEAGYDSAVDGEAYGSVYFQNANHSVRVTDDFMKAVENDGDWTTHLVTTGAPADTYKARDLMRQVSESAWICGDPGLQFDTTINKWHTCPNTARINASNPCSEYMFLDDTSCNLASLNLMKFRNPDGSFDVQSFKHTAKIIISAMEIIVGNSSYPTEAITRNSHEFRPLGIGYANLGALLMSEGLAYDGDDGRNFAAAITALLSGHAYYVSTLIAKKLGAFGGYAANEKPFLNVISMHRDAAYSIPEENVDQNVLREAREAWDAALESGKKNGFRNSQISVLAPTGTIGFLMDCDTTGVEPDIALIKYKWLVGGGLMKIVNTTVPLALEKLGYKQNEIVDIMGYLNEHETIEGAPHLKQAHLPVFDCAFKPSKGIRSIQYLGHVRMMAAVQPFISGAISKTVNLPADATAGDIENAYMQAWKGGLKAIAIYRDGSKRTQPLTTSKTESKARGVEERIVYMPMRQRLPDERQAVTHKFTIAGHEGYITVGLYEDGRPGEIFVTMAKEGSTISGLMDAFSTAVSIALQYGVPLKVLAKKFSNMRFEPSGVTGNEQIRFAKSITDYIFKWLAFKFLGDGDLEDLGFNPEERNSLQTKLDASLHRTLADKVTPQYSESGVPTEKILKDEQSKVRFVARGSGETQAFENQSDAPVCDDCGTIMVRSGSCYKCFNCGSTSGCS